jgi:M6 family metalloprotease-like protein
MKRLLLLLLLVPFLASAAPFAEWLQVPVPGGGTIRIWGEGDEYDAYFETEDGHPLRMNFGVGRYEYVSRDETTKAYEGTGVFLGDEAGNEALIASLPLRVRDESEAHDAAVRARIDEFEAVLHTRERWNEIKAQTERANEIAELAAKGEWDGPQPTAPTTGTIVGLTILVDFPVTNGTGQTTGWAWEQQSPRITRDVADGWFNREEPFGTGNYSVRKFYELSSQGRFDYTNVVIGPFRLPYPRSYYDVKTETFGYGARRLVNDAIQTVMSDAEWQTRYLPLFRLMTPVSGTSGEMRAINVVYAGARPSGWSVGLWPHHWTLDTSSSARKTWKNAAGANCWFRHYVIADAQNTPDTVSTTLHHENGHMVCGFPDLYHNSSASSKGVGQLSLMCYHGRSDVDPYLRAGAGWYTPKTLPSRGWVTITGDRSDVYKFVRSDDPREYFLIENRRRRETNANLQGDGIVIWRCNTAVDGNMKTARLSQYNSGHPSNNRYDNELSVEQADGCYHYELGNSTTQANDFWFEGNAASLYTGVFDNDSAACSRWRDGTASGLKLSRFSASGDTMTFYVGDPPVYDAPAFSTPADGGHVPLSFGKDGSNNPTFEVTIKNAAKDAWYTVYASDTVDGAYKAVTSIQATADGLLTLSIPAPSSKPTRFVRIGVSEAQVSTNTGL